MALYTDLAVLIPKSERNCSELMNVFLEYKTAMISADNAHLHYHFNQTFMNLNLDRTSIY